MFNFTDLIGLESSSQETEYRLRRGKINGLVYNTEQKLSNLLISFVVNHSRISFLFLMSLAVGENHNLQLPCCIQLQYLLE